MDGVVHLATTEFWEWKEEGKKIVVRCHEMWQDGEQSWNVYEEVDGRRSSVTPESEEFRRAVRKVQEHLLQR